MDTKRTRLWMAALAACGVAAAPALAHAQAAALVGSLANFDALNNTGEDAHGFEIQLDGISSADLTRIFGNWGGQNVIRYGAGTAADNASGTLVRWSSPWDPATQTFTLATPVPPTLTTVPGESCWTLGMGANYWSAGCEHFGISSIRNPTAVSYYWLVADPANPGQLMRSSAKVSLPQPVWTVSPPAQLGNPPVVAAEIVAPPAPEIEKFGDAQWVKVYKTENDREVALEELVGDNQAVVPQDAAHLETGWKLIQADPQVGLHKKQKGKLVNQGNMGGSSHAVVRRYEHYQYAGAYDPITHEALCADGTCSAPSPGELGDAIGAQNAAANVNVPSLTIARTGNGGVASADKVLSCGSKCSAFYALGASVTLTASPASGSVFAGWGGACSGADPTCTVSVNDAITVSAAFLPVYTLSIARSGNGTVTSSDASLSCGRTCSAKFVMGTQVTLTAAPAPGLSFTGWSNGCAGTDLTTTITVGGALTCQANFK